MIGVFRKCGHSVKDRLVGVTHFLQRTKKKQFTKICLHLVLKLSNGSLTVSAQAPACHLGQSCVLHMRVREAFSLRIQFEWWVTVLFDWSTHLAVRNCLPPPHETSH